MLILNPMILATEAYLHCLSLTQTLVRGTRRHKRAVRMLPVLREQMVSVARVLSR